MITTKIFTLLEDEALFIHVFEKPDANRHISLKIPASVLVDSQISFLNRLNDI